MTPRPSLFITPGTRFERLVAVKPTRKPPTPSQLAENKPGSRAMLCVCDCGNTTIVAIAALVHGNTKSCGCLHKERSSQMGKKTMEEYWDIHGYKDPSEGADISNMTQKFPIDLKGWRFTYLTVLDHGPGHPRNDKRTPDRTYICRCDCGNNTIVLRSNLLKGFIKSCGCLKASKRGILKHGLSRSRYYWMMNRYKKDGCVPEWENIVEFRDFYEALIQTHPDYPNFPNKPNGETKYPELHRIDRSLPWGPKNVAFAGFSPKCSTEGCPRHQTIEGVCGSCYSKEHGPRFRRKSSKLDSQH